MSVSKEEWIVGDNVALPPCVHLRILCSAKEVLQTNCSPRIPFKLYVLKNLGLQQSALIIRDALVGERPVPKACILMAMRYAICKAESDTKHGYYIYLGKEGASYILAKLSHASANCWKVVVVNLTHKLRWKGQTPLIVGD